MPNLSTHFGKRDPRKQRTGGWETAEMGARHILLASLFQLGSRSSLRNASLITSSHCFPAFPHYWHNKATY